MNAEKVTGALSICGKLAFCHQFLTGSNTMFFKSLHEYRGPPLSLIWQIVHIQVLLKYNTMHIFKEFRVTNRDFGLLLFFHTMD